MPVGHPNFGRTVICDCLDSELQIRRLDELQRRSNLDPLRHLTFESFDSSVAGVTDAYRAAREYAEKDFGAETHRWLVLYGPFGAGKTHLAAAIAHRLIERRAQVLFQVVPELLDHLRGAFAPGAPSSYDELFEAVKGAGVLILDDLGEENETPWVKEKLFLIFNHRYNYRLPTVVTTNRPPEAIEPRIWSRMFDRQLSVTVEVAAFDFRERPPRQRGGKPRRSEPDASIRRPIG